jgi:uncharacterized protein (TIGR00290 family)
MGETGNRTRVLVAWSSGKDAAWALHVLRGREDVEVVGLLTTVNTRHDRVSMHGVRRRLLEGQAEAVGLPLDVVPLPDPCPNVTYESAMAEALARARAREISAVAFGDLHLEDVRRYREKQMRDTGLEPLFPLWGRATTELAEEMIAGGLKARVACVDTKTLDASHAGSHFDRRWLRGLPEGVDPCGENGEFHTFAWDGPMFGHLVPARAGEVVTRDGFVFVDLLPDGALREDER